MIKTMMIPSILLFLSSTHGIHSFSPSLLVHRHRRQSTHLGYHFNNDDDYFNSSHHSRFHPIATTVGGGATINNNKDDNSLSSLSVTELKRILTDRQIDFRDCLEKRDLIERILTTYPSSTSGFGATTANNNNNLSSEENRVVNTFTRASPSVAYIQTVNVRGAGGGRRGFELKGTEVPVGAGSGFLWDDRVSIVFFGC